MVGCSITAPAASAPAQATGSGAAEQAYDAMVGPALGAFLSSGEQLGPEVEKASQAINQAFQVIRRLHTRVYTLPCFR